MTFYSNAKQKSYVLNPKGKPLYDGKCCSYQNI